MNKNSYIRIRIGAADKRRLQSIAERENVSLTDFLIGATALLDYAIEYTALNPSKELPVDAHMINLLLGRGIDGTR